MLLYIVDNVSKGTGKTGKPIKGNWVAAKKRYVYPERKAERVPIPGDEEGRTKLVVESPGEGTGKKRQKTGIKLVLREGAEVPHGLRMSPYMKIKTGSSYHKDEFGNIRSAKKPIQQANETGQRIREYAAHFALLPPEAQRARMSDSMKKLIDKVDNAAGGQEHIVEPPPYSEAHIKKLKEKDETARTVVGAPPLSPKERQALMEVNMYEQRLSVVEGRKKVKKSQDFLFVWS